MERVSRWAFPHAGCQPFVSFDDLSVRDTDFPPRRLAPIDVPRPLIHPAAPGFVSEESFHGSLLNELVLTLRLPPRAMETRGRKVYNRDGIEEDGLEKDLEMVARMFGDWSD